MSTLRTSVSNSKLTKSSKDQKSSYCIMYIIITFSLVLASICYYMFLCNLYLVDEIMEIKGPSELEINEKFTIRVLAPPSRKDLNNFILEYSICPSVHEIQVVWHEDGPPPLKSSFPFAHTHSDVTFHTAPDTKNLHKLIYADIPTETEAVLLIDADVFVDCQHLAFTQSVWRSSYDALVGFFPRLVSKTPDSTEYSLLGWRNILWESSYSIMLPAGVMLKKSYLQSLSKSTDVERFLTDNPFCTETSLPLWTVSLSAPAPIFVDIPYTIRSEVRTVSHSELARKNSGNSAIPDVKGRSEVQGKCVSDLVKLLNIEKFPQSSYKATIASTHVFW